MRRTKKGFTLAETLLAVAIIIILLTLAVFALPKYIKSLKQVEFNETAKEIFITAQNNLTRIVGQGYPGADEGDFGELEDAEKDIWFFTSSSAPAGSIFYQMLPEGSIDEAVRSGGSFIIRYQRSTGLVLDVFYSDPSDRNGCAIGKNDYLNLINIRPDKNARLSYNNSVIGYYGGTQEEKIPDDTGLKAPQLTIVNGDTLYVNVKSQSTTSLSHTEYLSLTIMGEDSGKTVTYDLLTVSPSYRFETDDYQLVLDDITTEGTNFKDGLGAEGFVPGENLYIQAMACYKDAGGKITQSAKSTTKKTNSLFADLSGSEVSVANIRHLQNLDYATSGFTGSTSKDGLPVRSISSAVQTTDLLLADFSGIKDKTYSFTPINPFTTLSYDGNEYIITGITANVAGNAGLFGTLEGGTIENLILEDFKITSTGGNAGAAAGSATDVFFSNILVYNNASARPDDSGFYIKAGKNAGGLVGSISGCTVEDCAAAVYVQGGSYAGGLIGSVSGGSVSSSYSGGHTEGGRYLQAIVSSASAKARINVQGTLGAGGLIGNVSGCDVSYSYSASSVRTGDSGFGGGLAGIAKNTSFRTCYAVGFVENAGTSENYIGSRAGCSFSGKHYYLTNLSPGVNNTINGVEGVSGKDDGRPNFIFIGSAVSKRQPAYIYDDTLKVDYGGKYYFPTVAQLHSLYGDLVYSGTDITRMHYGDWQVPYLDTLGFSFKNEDTLYLEIDPSKLSDGKDDKEYFIISITGENSTTKTSDQTIFYRVHAEGGDVNKAKIIDQGRVEVLDDQTKRISWNGSVSYNPPLTVSGGSIIITLDDVSASGRSFHEIFSGSALIPGENLSVRLAIGENVGVNEIMQVSPKKANSLFALGSTGSMEAVSTSITNGTACVGYVRHLLNLNSAISGIDADTFKKAVLVNSINWNDSKSHYAQVYASGAKISDGKFPGLENYTISEFDGKDNKLTAFEFVPSLFKTIGKAMNIHNLELCDCTASEGTLASTVTGSETVTVDTVLVRGAECLVSGNEYAGGIFGSSSANLVIKNSAASVFVKATGAAAGLVGKNTGTVTMDSCYAGGHTVNGKYDKENYNITSESGNAGGLIALNSGTATITKSFSAASVSGKLASGGIVGCNSAALSFDEVYCIAPVQGVRIDKNASPTAFGAVIGSSSAIVSNDNKSVYFLPELFIGSNDITILGNVDYIGSGSMSNPAEFAYYQHSEESNKISAKIFIKTMQIQTVPYDSSLASNNNGSVQEYPFSIWTSFPRRSGKTDFYEGTYYGDWEPINAVESVVHNITFNYTNPVLKNASGEALYVDLSSASLGTQKLIMGIDNNFVVPGTPYYPGYELKWIVSTSGGVVNEKNYKYREDNGRLYIDSAYCGEDLVASGTYVKTDSNTVSISFFYDPTGNNTTMQAIGSPKKVTKNTTWKNFMNPSGERAPVVEKTINDYHFVGWYKDEECTVPWEDGDYISADGCAYAKYEKLEFYTITIDFLYEIASIGEDNDDTTDPPRYSVDGLEQYRVVQPKGEAYNSSITLPSSNLEPISTRIVLQSKEEQAIANCGTVGGKPVFEADVIHNQCKIYAEDTAHFQVIYTIPAEKATANIGYYRLVYKFNDTQSGSASRAFKKGEASNEYPKGKTTFIPIDVDSEGNPVIPSIQFETVENFKCSNKVVPALTSAPSGAPVADNIKYFDFVVEYNRKQYKVYYNTAGGSPIEAKTFYVGEPVTEQSVTGVEKPTRSGYKEWSWGSLYKKGDAAKTPISFGIAMPAYNLEISGGWVKDSMQYTVIIWRQKVTDDRDATDAEKTYNFVSSEVRTLNQGATTAKLSDKDKSYGGTGATGDYQGFHFNESKSDTGNVTVRGDGTTVLNAYYDRNMVYMDFDAYYFYTPTEKEQAAGTVKGFKEGSKDGTASGLIDLKYNKTSGNWEYEEQLVSSEYITKSAVAAQVYKETDSNSGTQYASDGKKLEYQNVPFTLFMAWYKDGSRYNGDRYILTTDNELAAGTKYMYFDGNTAKTGTVPANNVLRKTGGTYYLYEIKTVYTPVKKAGQPAETVYRGLYGQDITKYGYTWPKGYYQTTSIYYNYNPGTRTASSKAESSSTSLTYLGQFKFSTANAVAGIMEKSTSVSNAIYFVKQNEDGSYPPDYTKVPDKGNMKTAGGSFNFSNKFDGYEISWYTSDSKGTTTNWKTATDGGSGNTYAVRFERKWYDVTVNYGYITPNDGIVFPAIDSVDIPVGDKIYIDTTDSNKTTATQYQENGKQIYYRKNAWRVENKDKGAEYTGTRYKEITSGDKAAGSTYYVNDGGMQKKTVPANKVLKKKDGKWYLVSSSTINPADFKKTVSRRFDTEVTMDVLKNTKEFGIPATLPIDGANYTWNGVVYLDDKCTSQFTGSDRVPSAPLQYFVCYTPPYQDVIFTPVLPSDAPKNAVVSWKSNTPEGFKDLQVKDMTEGVPAGSHGLQVLKGFSLDNYVNDEEGEYRDYFTPVCEGYEFIGWEVSGKEYYSSMPIDGKTVLTPVWEKLEIENKDQNRIVRVHHVDKNGNSVLPDELKTAGEEYQTFLVPCGQMAEFTSIYLDAYYPKTSLQKLYIQYYDGDDEGLDLTFQYNEVTTWTYSVEYRVSYTSYDIYTGMNPDSYDSYSKIKPVSGFSGTEYELGEITTKPAYSQYQSVVFELPAEYNGAYNLKKIDFKKRDAGGNDVTKTVTDNSYVVIDRGEMEYTDPKVEAKVIFYLEPDSTVIALGDHYKYYDGLSTESIAVDDSTYTAPAGTTVVAKTIYSFVSSSGAFISGEDIKDAGMYSANTCVVLEVTDNNTKQTDCYLMYKDVTGTLKYRIQARPVTLESASLTKAKSKMTDGYPITAPSVTSQSALGSPFVGNQGLDIYFSADAFRYTPGISDNSFTYALYDGTKENQDYTDPNNYFITLKYGKLEVTDN